MEARPTIAVTRLAGGSAARENGQLDRRARFLALVRSDRERKWSECVSRPGARTSESTPAQDAAPSRHARGNASAAPLASRVAAPSAARQPLWVSESKPSISTSTATSELESASRRARSTCSS